MCTKTPQKSKIKHPQGWLVPCLEGVLLDRIEDTCVRCRWHEKRRATCVGALPTTTYPLPHGDLPSSPRTPKVATHEPDNMLPISFRESRGQKKGRMKPLKNNLSRGGQHWPHTHRVLVRVGLQGLLPVSLPNLLFRLFSLALEAQDFMGLLARELLGHGHEAATDEEVPLLRQRNTLGGVVPTLWCSRVFFSLSVLALCLASGLCRDKINLSAGWGTMQAVFARKQIVPTTTLWSICGDPCSCRTFDFPSRTHTLAPLTRLRGRPGESHGTISSLRSRSYGDRVFYHSLRANGR